MSHDYSKIASELLHSLGGADNVQQAAHCVTRLRLALKDPSLVDSATLNQIDLVKGSFFTGGLYQVVIGPGEVEKVYAALREQTGLAASTIADVKQKGADKANAMQRLVRVFSDVFMPILPALIIAGLLMGVNNLLGAKGMFIEGKTLLDAYPQLDGVWSLINLMANTSFVFLPALVGWSAAKRFGGSEILGVDIVVAAGIDRRGAVAGRSVDQLCARQARQARDGILHIRARVAQVGANADVGDHFRCWRHDGVHSPLVLPVVLPPPVCVLLRVLRRGGRFFLAAPGAALALTSKASRVSSSPS